MKIEGRITISRKGNKGDSEIVMSVKDNLSNIEFLEARMSPEVFAEVVTGLAYGHFCGEVRGLEHVATHKYEHKYEQVLVDECKTDDDYQSAIAMYEVDGWKGRLADAKNWHNKNTENGTSRVTFVRWVKAEKEAK